MRITSMILMAAIAPCVAACATRQVLVSEATPAARDRIMGFDAPGRDTTEVTFIRDKGMMGGGCYLELFVDSIASARIATGEKVALFIPNGRHDVYAKPTGRALCHVGADTNRASRAAEITIEQGKPRLMRIAIDEGGITTITPYIQ